VSRRATRSASPLLCFRPPMLAAAAARAAQHPRRFSSVVALDAARRAARHPRRFSSVVALDADADVNAAIKGTVGGPVLVLNFTAAWCGPCRAVAPHYEALAATFASRAVLAKVDIDGDAVQAATAAAGVTAVPTYQFYVGGKMAAEVRGADLKAIKAALEELAGGAAPA